MPFIKHRKYWNILIQEFNVKEVTMFEGWKIWIENYGDTERSKSDFMWQLFNTVQDIFTENLTGREYFDKKLSLYYTMIEFLKEEKRGFNHIKKAIYGLYLDRANILDYQVNVEIIAPQDCIEGAEIDGLVLDWKDANDRQILPYSKCKRKGGCVCTYATRIKYDANGEPIMK